MTPLESLAEMRNVTGAMFRAIAATLDQEHFDRLFDQFEHELKVLGIDRGFGRRADQVLKAGGYEIGATESARPETDPLPPA